MALVSVQARCPLGGRVAAVAAGLVRGTAPTYSRGRTSPTTSRPARPIGGGGAPRGRVLILQARRGDDDPDNWPRKAMRSMMFEQVDLALAEASARLNPDWEGDVAAFPGRF